ncbi:MAG: sodium:proton antiporter [Verrucomicrobiota bacterium]|jgi:CPA1 family monovalent cation:H+ antiporter|nr:sodium:proton antiporter [Verrucomicrobiota bacterium]
MALSFVAILTVACGMALLAKRFRLPYTVVLVVAGLIVSVLASAGEAESIGLDIHLSPELLLQLFLPILLFEAAFHVDLRQFLNNWRPILCLAIPGVIVGMLLTTGFFLLVDQVSGMGLSWQMILLIAAMLAATDPISVVALFKEFSVSKRLGIIVEGESLINDGVAVVLFGVVVKITAIHLGLTLPHFGNAISVEALQAVLDFLREVLLGTATGLGVGLAISYLTSKFDDQHIEVALTVIAAFGANIVAMELHASGVIAVVVCGMMIGNVGVKHGMSPTTREEVVSFWEFAAFLANSFVFILIGLKIQLSEMFSANVVGPIAVFFVIMMGVRVITVYGVHGLVRRSDLRLKERWLPVIAWSGVRGSLSMVLAMMLVWVGDAGLGHDKHTDHVADVSKTEQVYIAESNNSESKVSMVSQEKAMESKATILNIVYGVVLLSILLQGTTMEWLMKRAGLIEESSEETEYEMALARRQAIRALLEDLESAERKGSMANETYAILNKRLTKRREANDQRMEAMLEKMPVLNEIELEMESAHLRALEKQIYRDLEKEGELDYDSMEELVQEVVERAGQDKHESDSDA